MDCQPSWQDVKADRDFFQTELNCLRESHYRLREIEFGLRAERDALAAYAEAGKHIVHEWGRGELGDVAAAVQLDQWARTQPALCLARLKAEWQAEGADIVAERAIKRIQWYALGSTDAEKAANHATLIANELRRQAEGGDS